MRRRSALTMTVTVVVAAFAAAFAIPAAPAAATGGAWLRPVAGRVVRPFQPPLTRFGAGHLGADLAAAPGTLVRAAGAGTVQFAGPVATALHVVLLHPGGLETSYSFLATVRVHRGEAVERGTVLGTTGGRGENHDGTVVHFALRVGGRFVDPMQLFAEADLVARVHLVPWDGGDPPTSGPDAPTRARLPAAIPGPRPAETARPRPATGEVAVRLRAAVAPGERALALWWDWVT